MTNELLDSTTINKIAEIFDKERENGRATGKNFNLLKLPTQKTSPNPDKT